MTIDEGTIDEGSICLKCGHYNAMIHHKYDNGITTLKCRDCGWEAKGVAPIQIQKCLDCGEYGTRIGLMECPYLSHCK